MVLLSKDLQTIIEEFDLDEHDAKLFRAVVAYLESRSSRKGKAWDRTYKGKEHWLLFRAKVLRLVRDNLIVSYSTLKQDPWFATNERQPMDHATKWQRAYDQHLIGNKPEGPDDHQFRAFQLRDNDTIFVTVEDYLHCAIAKAAKGRKDAAGLIRETRRRFEAEERCAWCERRYRGGTIEESIELPVMTHGSEGGEGLDEAERAGLQARPAEDQ